MDKPIHLLIPASGRGTRYQKAGYTVPKPIVPIGDRTMIERVLECFPMHWKTHAVLADNHLSTGLPKEIRRLRPDVVLSSVPAHDKGPGMAALEGLKRIPDDHAVFLNYCDYGMVWDSARFERFVRETDCDACLVSYRGFHAHYLSPQMYAYSRIVGERVVEVREKGCFTDDREQEYASAGGYYFKSAELLKQALEFQMKNGLEIQGEYFTSLTVEALLRMNPSADVRVFEIPYFFQWGTPQDLQRFEFWEKSCEAFFRDCAKHLEVEQVLMPMAGVGSRFSAITKLPKPLIPVAGEPMYQRALDSLPRAKHTVLVALDSFADQLKDDACVVRLKQTPAGQALSTLHGMEMLKPGESVVVSSCDHAIALEEKTWREFRSFPRCDAAIFTIRGFSGTNERPHAYAYVVTEDDSTFSKVKKVSVKQPVSAIPSKDRLLVGTFWFRSPQILQKGIEELKRRDIRVNGELYLDSVFDLLAEMGHEVRVIPLSGYLCFGDPDSLAEALYWWEVFSGKTIARRARFPGVS